VSPAETARLLAVVAAAYPSFEVDEIRHRVWTETLGDLDYELASLAVRRHIASSKWPPAVAEIREHAFALSSPDHLSGAEAWGELMGAVRRFGYYAEVEGLASLSPETRQVAELIGWRDINLCEEVDVLRGQFLRMYQQVEQRAQREAFLPAGLRSGALESGESHEVGHLAAVRQLASGIGKVMP
jgi:hypothetical protein